LEEKSITFIAGLGPWNLTEPRISPVAFGSTAAVESRPTAPRRPAAVMIRFRNPYFCICANAGSC